MVSSACIVQLNHHHQMANALVFWFFFILASSMDLEIAHACDPSQRSSLLLFAHTLSSPQLNWTSADCCSWEGVTCNLQGSWITHLQLPYKQLKLKQGIFRSSSLANLTHLTHLNLSHNSLYGSLDQTQLFFSLKVIDLSYNLLFGVLPYSFFHQAWKLTSFNVSHNTFSGPIPSSMCLSSSSSSSSSSTLRHLDFSFNNFSGSIPSGLGKCSKLQVFRAGHNYLSGLFPEDIYNATTVEEISLPLNSLNGEINDGIVSLINLKTLDLSYNQFSGVLPLQLGKLSNLRCILLDFNSLQGSLPPSLMNCTKLVELRMGSNNLGGNLSIFDFSNFGQLTKLDLRMNNFSGVLPRSLYSCKFLKAIRVSYNNLEIEIPSEIVSLKSLSFLSLGGNKRLTNIKATMKILMACKSLVVLSLAYSFEGEEFPSDLGKADFDGFQNVRILDLSYCNLTGHIPLWLLSLGKLEILHLGNNRLTGSIPSWIGNLPKLFSIIMDHNLLSGELPKEMWILPLLASEQAAAQVGRTPSDLPIFDYSYESARALQYNFIYYAPYISLKGNNLQGKIPSEIGKAKLLKTLYLSGNKLSGNIPDQIADLKDLQFLDISMNHLSGNIPESVTGLHFLSKFNVSYNDLEGPIPLSTQLQSFDASEFKGNPKLCGDPLPRKCMRTKGNDEPDKNDTETDMKKQEFPWCYVSAALGFITGFWGVFGPVVFLRKWRHVYYQFLDNMYERLMVMLARSMSRMKQRFTRRIR